MKFTAKSRESRSRVRAAILALLVGAIGVMGAGCSGNANSSNNNSTSVTSDDDGFALSSNNGEKGTGVIRPIVTEPKEAIPIAEETPVNVFKPVLVLTDEFAKTCLVKQGDAMPELKLLDLDGDEQLLSSFYGEKLTVVVFWTTESRLSKAQYTKIQGDVLEEFSGLGVNAVAVSVGDPIDDVKEFIAEEESESDEFTFPTLVDPDAAAFGQVATEKMPRTYVLDAEGRILWLDIGYSRSTQRELKNAVHYYLLPPEKRPQIDGSSDTSGKAS